MVLGLIICFLIFSVGLKSPGAVGILSAAVNSVTAMVVVLDFVAILERRKVKSIRQEYCGNTTWIWDDNHTKNQR